MKNTFYIQNHVTRKIIRDEKIKLWKMEVRKSQKQNAMCVCVCGANITIIYLQIQQLTCVPRWNNLWDSNIKMEANIQHAKCTMYVLIWTQ